MSEKNTKEGKTRAQITLESAFEPATEEQLQVEERNCSLAAEVEEYINTTKAWFTLNSVYQALGVTTQKHVKDRKNVRMKVLRMVDKNILERDTKKEGIYRIVDETCDEIKWWEDEEEDVPIKLPFNLHKYVKIYPGNIILISGLKDSGKTGMMLRIIQDNFNNSELCEYYKSHIHYPDIPLFHYYNCETPKAELRPRIKLVAGKTYKEWQKEVKFWERTHAFAQVMQRHVINLVDYLDAKEDPFKMKAYMDQIHDKIYGGAGIAIVARQLVEKEYKGKKVLSGFGGNYVKNKPRLVVQLTGDCLLVENAKTPRMQEDGKFYNINGWTARFTVKDGHFFEITKELGPQMYNPLRQRWE